MLSHILLVAMKPSRTFIKDLNMIGRLYLVICDGIGQLLNKSIQDFGVLNIEYEFDERVLFRDWLKLRSNSIELPESGVNGLTWMSTSTNLRSSNLLLFSA